VKVAVLTPTTRPELSSRGPPLLPALMDASHCGLDSNRTSSRCSAQQPHLRGDLDAPESRRRCGSPQAMACCAPGHSQHPLSACPTARTAHQWQTPTGPPVIASSWHQQPQPDAPTASSTKQKAHHHLYTSSSGRPVGCMSILLKQQLNTHKQQLRALGPYECICPI
jgi:hypothetical protein